MRCFDFCVEIFEKVKLSYKYLNFVVFYENTMEIFVHKFYAVTALAYSDEMFILL